MSRLYSATTSRYAAHLRQPLNPRQQALVQQTQARQLYLASRAVVRPDVRSEAQRRADHAAGVLQRQTNLAAVLSPATATTARHDPALRSIAGAVVVAGTAQLAAAAVAEEVAAWATWRGLGWLAARGMGIRFVANAAGQGAGNYVLYGDAQLAIDKINWVSPFLSAANIPLAASSLVSSAFRYDRADRFQSIATGEVSPYAFGRDAAVGYGFGQATRLSGFDNWFRSSAATALTSEARYQAQLRLSPRFAAGVGAALPSVLETGNRTAAGAVRKVGAAEVKRYLPK